MLFHFVSLGDPTSTHNCSVKEESLLRNFLENCMRRLVVVAIIQAYLQFKTNDRWLDINFVDKMLRQPSNTILNSAQSS